MHDQNPDRYFLVLKKGVSLTSHLHRQTSKRTGLFHVDATVNLNKKIKFDTSD
jgi:hypothetical protein